MSAERTLTAPIPGPVALDLSMSFGTVHLTVTDTDRAHITLTSTAPADSPAAQAIAAATLTANARVLTVTVPTPEQPDGITVISHGNGRHVTVSGNINSGIIVSGGSVNISGSVIGIGNHVTGRSGVNITPGVHAAVVLPRGSALRMRTTGAAVTTRGELEFITFTAVSGSLDAEACTTLNAESTSGDIRAGYADHATARTVSGDIRLGRTETVTAAATSGDIRIGDFGGTGRLSTVSGDITVQATEPGHLSASAISGDITVTAPPALVAEGALTVDARSRSGDVCTPRPPSIPSRPRRPRRAPGQN
ncbi:DUF4097 family beta strand repeat-containing protein [Streptosporangium sp. NBC_01469]|uniref:DUF4097 family beta strand repeat-containing protein n=1 Tax=Streptosporangium sp. NBC_01469 TaxID=2903898 RepID=UPI002E2D0B2C|nr:DUF4097 family beta strand repeat-containing protein [Streptosporangium sp. NBC_01469]